MKIAVFYNLPSGGARRTVLEQIKRLARRHQVDVYTLGNSDLSYWDELLQSKFITKKFHPTPLFNRPFRRLNQLNRSLDIIRLRNLERNLAKEIDQSGYDLVLIHPCSDTISPAIIQFLNTPIVYYSHDVNRFIYDPVLWRPYNERNGLQRIFDRLDPLSKLYYSLMDREDRRGRQLCDIYLTNSYFTRESIYRSYGRAPTVCYHGIDTDLFKPLNLTRKYQVLCVGALVPNKGYDFVIESLRTIDELIRPPLIIVANSIDLKEKAYIECLAVESRVKLSIQSLITDEALVRLYNESQLTIYSPIMESFGLVPLELMACKTPVVGIFEGGVRETIQSGENGLLTERNPVLFGASILNLLIDEERRQDMGQKGRDYVLEQWNWDKAMHQLEVQLEQASIKRKGRDD